jgi:hypothetical protein
VVLGHKMNKLIFTVVLGLLIFYSFPIVSYADTVEDRISVLEKKVEELERKLQSHRVEQETGAKLPLPVQESTVTEKKVPHLSTHRKWMPKEEPPLPAADAITAVLETIEQPAHWLACDIKKGLVQLEEVKTTDTKRREYMGVKFSLIQYEARIKFLKKYPHEVLYLQGVLPPGNGAPSEECLIQVSNAKAGETRSISCAMMFVLTKQGWVGPDGRIY